MPTLYTMPGTCSLSPNIAIAWLDAPVAIQNIPYGDQKKEYYLAINPRGQVPALRFKDGDVLTEATAILAWLGAPVVRRATRPVAGLAAKKPRRWPT